MGKFAVRITSYPRAWLSFLVKLIMLIAENHGGATNWDKRHNLEGYRFSTFVRTGHPHQNW
jgi:hypothetical protein